MATVGYFEGTDPHTLTSLVVSGVETLPLSNGYDNHGRTVGHLTAKDGVSLVIGYLHKALPAAGTHQTANDILYNLKVHQIPVLLIVGPDDVNAARTALGEMGDYVKFTSSDQLLDSIRDLIG